MFARVLGRRTAHKGRLGLKIATLLVGAVIPAQESRGGMIWYSGDPEGLFRPGQGLARLVSPYGPRSLWSDDEFAWYLPDATVIGGASGRKAARNAIDRTIYGHDSWTIKVPVGLSGEQEWAIGGFTVRDFAPPPATGPLASDQGTQGGFFFGPPVVIPEPSATAAALLATGWMLSQRRKPQPLDR